MGFLVQEQKAAPEVGRTGQTDASEGDREPNRPVSEHGDAVDHEVGHHDVHGALSAAESGLDHREAGLHEHDQIAGDEHPDEVDGETVLVHISGQVIGEWLVGFGLREGGVGVAVGIDAGETLASADADAAQVGCSADASSRRVGIIGEGCREAQAEDGGRNGRDERHHAHASKASRHHKRRLVGFQGGNTASGEPHCLFGTASGSANLERAVALLRNEHNFRGPPPVASEVTPRPEEDAAQGDTSRGEPVTDRELDNRDGKNNGYKLDGGGDVAGQGAEENEPADRIDGRPVVVEALAKGERNLTKEGSGHVHGPDCEHA